MKREIKFRAWNEGKMIDLLAITPLALDANMNTQLALRNMGGLFLPFGGNIELMQYTGLKDKLGKEIYEGDIIQRIIHCKSGDNIVVNSQVEFNNLTAMFTTKVDSEYNDQILSDYAWEVIGNIYENELLLK